MTTTTLKTTALEKESLHELTAKERANVLGRDIVPHAKSHYGIRTSSDSDTNREVAGGVPVSFNCWRPRQYRQRCHLHGYFSGGQRRSFAW